MTSPIEGPGSAGAGQLRLWVPGRPAPKGSKEHGNAGQLIESSKYLPAWMDAVKVAAYREYRRLGVPAASLPLLRGPVGIDVTFAMEGPADEPPDLDKLERAVWDALTRARAWEDDKRVVDNRSRKITGPADVHGVRVTGAQIHVWQVL